MENNQFTPEQQALEGLADTAIGQVSLASSRKQLLQAVMGAENFDDVVARLLDIYPQLDMENLEEMVARSLLAAELFGRMNASGAMGDAQP